MAILNNQENPAFVNNQEPVEYAGNGLKGVNTQASQDSVLRDSEGRIILNGRSGRSTSKSSSKATETPNNGPRITRTPGQMNDWYKNLGRSYEDFGDPEARRLQQEQQEQETEIPDSLAKRVKNLTDTEKELINETQNLGAVESAAANKQNFWQIASHGIGKMFTMAGGDIGNLVGMGWGLLSMGNKQELADKAYQQAIADGRSEQEAEWDRMTVYTSNIADNAVTNWVAKTRKDIEDAYLPIYRTDAQKAAAWYSPKNIFSMQFLFDDIIPNVGFMVAGGWTVKGAGKIAGWALRVNKARRAYKGAVGALTTAKGVEAYQKALKAAIAGEKALTGDKLFDEVVRIGKLVNKRSARAALVAESIGAMSEAGFDAVDGTRDWYELEMEKLKNTIDMRYGDEAITESVMGRNTTDNPTFTKDKDGNNIFTDYGHQLYSDLETERDRELDRGTTRLQVERAKMANNILLGETILLSLTNKFNFDYMLRSGYRAEKTAFDMAKEATKFKKTGVFKKDVKNLTNEISRSLERELRKTELVTKGNKWLSPFVEAFEEMGQSYISNAAGIKGAAILNRYMGYTVDPDANENVTNIFKAFADQFNSTIGNPDTYKEGAVAMISSILGLPAFTYVRDNNGRVVYQEGKNGKKRPKRKLVMQGEFWDASRETAYIRKNGKDMIARLNEMFDSDEKIDQFRNFVRSVSVQNLKRQAVETSNIFAYKNGESAQFVNMANAFYKAGRMEDLYQIVELAANIDESQVDDIKDALRDEETGESIYEGMQPAEVVKAIHDRGESMKEDIEDYVKIRQGLEDAYGVDVDPDFLDTMTWGLFTFTDAGNRINELAKEVWGPLTRIIDRINQLRPDGDKIQVNKGLDAAHAIIDFLFDSKMTQKEKDQVQSKLDKFFEDMEGGDATMQNEAREGFLNWLNMQIERRKSATDEANVKTREMLEERRQKVLEADITANTTGWAQDSLARDRGAILDVSKKLCDIMALVLYRNYVLSGIVGMSQKPGLFNSTQLYMEQKALDYTIQKEADYYMSTITDEKRMKSRQQFGKYMDNLRGSIAYDEVVRRIEQGNNQKLKLWLREKELAGMAKNSLRRTLHRWADFRARDGLPQEAIDHLKNIIDARLSTVKNENGTSWYGEPTTLQELYDMVEALLTSPRWNNGKAWENIFNQKDVDELVKLLDQFKEDANYQKLAKEMGQDMPAIKPQEEKKDDEGKDDKGNGEQKPGDNPSPQNPPEDPHPGSGPSGPQESGGNPGGQQSTPVTDKERNMLEMADGDSLVSKSNIGETRRKGKTLTNEEVLQAADDIRALTDGIPDQNALAEALTRAAREQPGSEGTQFAEYRPYANKIFLLKNELDQIIKERGLGEILSGEQGGSEASGKNPAESAEERKDNIPDEISDEEVDKVKGILDDLSATDSEGNMLMDEAHLNMELMKYEMDPEYHSELSEASRNAIKAEIKRLIGLFKGVDNSAHGLRPDGAEPQRDAREVEGKNNTDFGNEGIIGDNSQVPDGIVKGKPINNDPHDEVDELPGMPVTDCAIGPLLEGNLKDFDATKYGETLPRLQQILKVLKVYDFVNSGALGVIAKRKGGSQNVKVHFLISSQDNVTIEDQTQEGKNGKVYNILLAVKIDSKTRQALKEGGDFEAKGKTQYVTIDGEQYQVIGMLSKGARFAEQDAAYNSVYDRVIKNSVEPQMREHPDQKFFLGKDGDGVIYTTIGEIGSGRMVTKKNDNPVGFRPVQEVTQGLVGSHFIGMIVPGRDGNGLMMITNDKEVTSELGPVGEKVQPILDNPKTAGTLWLITLDAAGDYSYSYLKIPSLAEFDIEEALKSHPGNLFLSQLVADVNQLFNADPRNHFLKRHQALERIMEKLYFPKDMQVKLDARPNAEGNIGLTVTDIYGEEHRYENADDFFAKLTEDGIAFRITKDALMNPTQFEMMKEAGLIQSDYVDAEHHGANFTVKFLPDTGNTYRPEPKSTSDPDSKDRKLDNGPDNGPTSSEEDALQEGMVNIKDAFNLESERQEGGIPGLSMIFSCIANGSYEEKYYVELTDEELKEHPEFNGNRHLIIFKTEGGSIPIITSNVIRDDYGNITAIGDAWGFGNIILDLRKEDPFLDFIKSTIKKRSQDNAAKEADRAAKSKKGKKSTKKGEKVAETGGNGPLSASDEATGDNDPVTAEELTAEQLAALGLSGNPAPVSDAGNPDGFNPVGTADGEFVLTSDKVLNDIKDMADISDSGFTPETLQAIADEFMSNHNLADYKDEDSYLDDLSTSFCNY